MIETFKVVKGFSKVNKDDWFIFRNEEETRRTRSTASVSEFGEIELRNDVMYKENVNLEVRKNFFNVRIVREWNKIPDEVKKAKSVNAFKNAFDRWKSSENINT